MDRYDYLQKAENDDTNKIHLIEKARRDVVFFFNQFATTYDPRPEAKPNHFPFLTYPFQDDFIKDLEMSYRNVSDLLVEKTRDMGISWVVLSFIVHHWLFDPSFNALVGSRKEDLVDNFQPDSLFGKMDYLIRRLPVWLLPQGYRNDQNRTFCKIVNPENGNTIQGESANRDFSRQGRYTLIFLDEFAFWDNADAVWTATADSAPIRIVVSTPHGKNNKFADLRFSNQIKVKSLHWTLHPHKNQEWYEAEKSRRTPREVAQELDIDYEASGSERVFSLKTNKELRQGVVIDPFEVPNDWAFRGGLDYGTRNVSSFHVYAMGKDHDHYAVYEWRRNMEQLRAEGFQGSMVQAIAKMLFECPYYGTLDHIRADPSLWVKNQNSADGMTSIIQQIYDEFRRLQAEKAKEGEQVEVKGFVEGAQEDLACIQFTNTLWADPKNPQFKIFRNCKGLIEELEELMWEEWSEAQQEKRNTREKIMDRNNHSWDDFKYYIMSRQKPKEEAKKPYPRRSMGWFMERASKEESKKGRLRWM